MSEAPYKKTRAPSKKPRKEPSGVRTGEWNSGIFGCCTFLVPNCCMATCLPFISIAQIAHRINVARYAYVLLTFLALYILEIVFAIIASAALLKSFNEAVQQMDAQNNDNGGWNWNASGGAFADDENDGYGNDGPSLKVSTTGFMTAAVANVAAGVIAFLYFVAIWQLRTKVRERFQIPGSCCGDFCCVWWCSCCTIAQMATHVKSYKPGSCDFGPPDVLPPYNIGTPES